MECNPVTSQVDLPRPSGTRSALGTLIELLATAVQTQLQDKCREVSLDSSPEKSPLFSEIPVDFKGSQSVYPRHQTGKTH